MKRLLLVAGIAAISLLTVTEASSEYNSYNGSGETTPMMREKRSPPHGPPKCPPHPVGPDGMTPSPDRMPPCGPPPDMDSQMKAKRSARGPQSDGKQGGADGRAYGHHFSTTLADSASSAANAMGDMVQAAENVTGGATPGTG